MKSAEQLSVFATGRLGQTAVKQSSEADILRYASRLVEAGHQNVRVGLTPDDAMPFADWCSAHPGRDPSAETTYRFQRS